MTIRGLTKALGIGLLALVLSLLLAWSALAIYFSNLPWQPVRFALAGLYGIAVISAFALLERRGRTIKWFLVATAGVIAWWITIKPSQLRDWAPEVSLLPKAVFVGDDVTITNLRDFEYRSEQDFTVHYEQRTYDLKALESMDLVLSYWGGNRSIAHVILSFGFAGGDHVAVSVETRPEKGEGYSILGSLFKQFEVIYILAEERDVVQLRTNFRKERVYLFPTRLPPGAVRLVFRQLLEEANALVEQPVFYHALEHNCTTAWVAIAEEAGGRRVKFDMRLLLNGYLDQLMYERDKLVGDETQGMPYEDMRSLHLISDVARLYQGDPNFSAKVRSHLPKVVK
ncbi:MAG TPA: DUF4105 domain-containing protein [Planctomycetota bacterium]|nr:DUF4105 domain-containing protein [Planctomycetota bacterium]